MQKTGVAQLESVRSTPVFEWLPEHRLGGESHSHKLPTSELVLRQDTYQYEISQFLPLEDNAMTVSAFFASRVSAEHNSGQLHR
jgi:hypothetical protein